MSNPELNKSFDFVKIKLLASLLKDYNVKHIVLSPGGRDVPIIRMFEYNEKHFTLHRVTDERSAAYFGLGLASRLKEPVACVCTSGTAASNYLPAVTEAYFTGVPLILITADRYEIYHGQGEDQTIPQKNIFNGVIKMSVSLREENGFRAEHQIKRDVQSCILEATNKTFGPVHINVPIQNIAVGEKCPREDWELLPFQYPHLQRVGFENGEEKLFRWVDSLKKTSRILIVYGQNAPLTDAEKKYVNDFASKYNCAIVTDSISNFSSEYSINPFTMLNKIDQERFNCELCPDILITVGGKRLMNDPLTFKVRANPKVRHWSVTPDGQVKDFYFCLSSIIECTQNHFFKWFSEKAGNIKNDKKYLSAWKSLVNEFEPNTYPAFDAIKVQDIFFPRVPKNSFLHLGVGQSFFFVRRYNLDPSIDVYCNMGTNGIDGCTSTFMGQCAITKDKLCFLIVGDLSFFYDMNSIWNKELHSNMRILLVNNNGSGLLRNHNLKAITSVHNTSAKGWIESTGFKYMSASTEQEFKESLNVFLNKSSDYPLFLEVFCK